MKEQIIVAKKMTKKGWRVMLTYKGVIHRSDKPTLQEALKEAYQLAEETK